jgi:hypothetical protein
MGDRLVEERKQFAGVNEVEMMSIGSQMRLDHLEE